MDGIEIVVMILMVSALLGIVVYFAYTYITDRDTVNTKLSKVDTTLANETSNRLGNVKYVVDQLNTSLGDIAGVINSSNTKYLDSVSLLQGSNTALYSRHSNVSEYINIGSRASPLSLFDLPGKGNVDINLLQNVNAVMNMTISGGLTANAGINANNLKAPLTTYPSSNATFCFGPDNKNCIQFPDKSGNTYITSPDATHDITMSSRNVYVCPPGETGSPAKCTTISTLATGEVTISPPSGASVETKKIILDGNTKVKGNIEYTGSTAPTKVV